MYFYVYFFTRLKLLENYNVVLFILYVQALL